MNPHHPGTRRLNPARQPQKQHQPGQEYTAAADQDHGRRAALIRICAPGVSAVRTRAWRPRVLCCCPRRVATRRVAGAHRGLVRLHFRLVRAEPASCGS